MKKLAIFIYAILGGICIAIAGTVYLSVENKAVGALLFTLGLFIIVTNGFNLFTGKVSYIFERPAGYLLDVCVIWIGNFAGCLLVGIAERQTRILPAIIERAESVVSAKLNDNLSSIFILAVFCGILMYVAVDGFAKNEHHIGKYIGLFLCVGGFIICGFEHCVANMYYISVADAWSGNALLYMAVMTLGNSVGGVLFPLCKQLHKKIS